MVTADQRVEPPWSALDPSIEQMVRMFWDAGFQPTDSGDGVTKRGGEMDQDGAVFHRPHVAMRVAPDALIAETDRAIAVLEAAGYVVDSLTGWHVEGVYSGGVGLVMVIGPDVACDEGDASASTARGPDRIVVVDLPQWKIDNLNLHFFERIDRRTVIEPHEIGIYLNSRDDAIHLMRTIAKTGAARLSLGLWHDCEDGGPVVEVTCETDYPNVCPSCGDEFDDSPDSRGRRFVEVSLVCDRAFRLMRADQ